MGKSFHRYGKDVRGKRWGVANTQSNSVAHRANPFNGKVCVPEQFSRFLKKCLAGGRETNGMSLSVEQTLADGFFQRLNLPT